MMRREVVERRGWFADRDFLDLVGATALIPGPNSTELAIWIGQRRAGWRGLLVAGVSFILPASLIVGVLAELYVRYGATPTFADLRYGVLPVIVAVVAHAVWGLGRTAVRGAGLLALAVGAAALRFAGIDELVVLAVGAAVGLLMALWHGRGPPSPTLALVPSMLLPAAVDVGLGRLFVVFVKFGSVVFGSGYVLVAFLEHDLVDVRGWLTRAELLDAVAIGQVTPGPVFTTATFVGYLLRGVPGAAVATVGIFLPSFVLVAVLARLLPVVQRSAWARGFLDGVNAVALGLMAAVCVELADQAVVDVATGLVAAVALAVLVRTRLNVMWLIAAGVAIGGVRALVT